MLNAHGTIAQPAISANVQTSVSIVIIRLPNHLHQDNAGVWMQPAVFNMQLHHANGLLGLLGEVLVEVSLAIISGEDSVKASNASDRRRFISFLSMIHLAIQLLTRLINTGRTKRAKNEPHSGCIRR
jgi:hypothetical protein